MLWKKKVEKTWIFKPEIKLFYKLNNTLYLIYLIVTETWSGIFISTLPCRHMAPCSSVTLSINTLWPGSTSPRSLLWWSISTMWIQSLLATTTCWSPNSLPWRRRRSILTKLGTKWWPLPIGSLRRTLTTMPPTVSQPLYLFQL